jgi:hypothetical protein
MRLRMQECRSDMYRNFCLLTLLSIILSCGAFAQDTEIKIQAIDGKSGKPLVKQRLVIFGGESAEAATFHHTAFDITTDEKGMAELKFSTAKTSWIQVWADGMTLCQTKPNIRSFSVETILATGLSAPNSCSPIVQAGVPGHFTVYARPSNLREKMGR